MWLTVQSESSARNVHKRSVKFPVQYSVAITIEKESCVQASLCDWSISCGSCSTFNVQLHAQTHHALLDFNAVRLNPEDWIGNVYLISPVHVHTQLAHKHATQVCFLYHIWNSYKLQYSLNDFVHKSFLNDAPPLLQFFFRIEHY